VDDSLHREEFGAMGKVSKVGVCAEKNGEFVPVFVLEMLTKGIDETMKSDAATVTTMGSMAALSEIMPPSSNVHVKTCRTLPVAS
jgi:hypothetical protein